MYRLKFDVVTVLGQILLYDLRSNRPSLVKDHNYGLPIKDIEFHRSQSLVLSCDSRILKLWDEHMVLSNVLYAFVSVSTFIQFFDAVGWAMERTS